LSLCGALPSLPLLELGFFKQYSLLLYPPSVEEFFLFYPVLSNLYRLPDAGGYRD
jgi:hypothetical protein